MSHWIYNGSVALLLAGAAGDMVGSTSGTATVSGALIGTGDLVGSISCTATTSGTLVGAGAMAGSASGVATTSGFLSGGVFWVSTLGDDSNAGINYDDGGGPGSGAKLTLAASIPLLSEKGYILNVVNDGNHTYTVSTTGTSLPAGTKGTNFSDYGSLIRGTDGSGNPALSTIEAKAGDGDNLRTIIRIPHDAGYLIMRNLVFDSTSTSGNINDHRVLTFHDSGSPDPGPVRFEGCSFLGDASATFPSGNRQAVVITATPPVAIPYTEFDHCYFQNCRGEIVSGGNNAGGMQKTFDHCYVIQNWTTATNERFFGFTNTESSSGLLRVKNATFYISIGAQAFTTGAGIIDYAPDNGTNVGTVDVYNNVIFVETTHADPDIMFFEGTGGGISVTFSGTIDYNVLLGGPNVTSGDVNDTQGWYQDPWDSGSDPNTNDTEDFSLAEATVFNAPGSTYAWDALLNGVTIPTLKDLRLILYTTAGQGGDLPGALPQISLMVGSCAGVATVTGTLTADVDVAVDIQTSNPTPLPLHSFLITVTASCSGGNLTGVTYTAAIPVGIEFLSSIPSVGSYSDVTGIWNIGSLNDGVPQALVLTVRPLLSSENMTITFFASTTTYTPSNDPNLSNNTDSVQITVATYEKVLASASGNEKVLASQSSNEKVVAP